MAAEAIIGALRVILGADTGQLEEGTKRAAKQLNMFDKAVRDATGGLLSYRGLLSTIASGAFVAFLKSAVKVGEEIELASKRIGFSAEAYQELAYAAEIAGVSTESIVKAIGRLQVSLGGTEEDIGKADKALARLGLSIKDIRALNPEEQFKTVSDALSRVENVTERTRIGVDLMGKTFLDSQRVTALSRAELEAFANEARRLGFILSDETIEKAGKADDEFDRLSKALKVAGTIIAAEFLPFIEGTRKVITSPEFQQGIKDFRENLEKLFKVIANNAPVIAGVAAGLVALRFGAFLGPVGAATAALIGFGVGATSAMTELQKVDIELRNAKLTMALFQDQVTRLEKAMEIEPTMWRKERLTEVSHALDEQKKRVAELEEQYKALQETGEKLKVSIPKPPPESIIDPEVLKKIEDAIAKVNFETRIAQGQFSQFPEGALQSALALGLIKINAEGIYTIMPGLTDQFRQFMQAQRELAEAKDADPITKLGQSLTTFNQQLAMGSVTWGTWSKAAKDAAVQAASSVKKMSDDMLGGFQQLFAALGRENKQFFALGQGLAIAMAVINTAEAVTKALAAYPPPFNAVAAAAAAAAGAAQIITIKQQKYTGAAMGGSFTVPGGSMGIDTKFIPMALAPGERVDVTPAEQVQDGNRYLEIPAINPRDFFTGETVRELVFAIDQWMRDGGTGVRFVRQ